MKKYNCVTPYNYEHPKTIYKDEKEAKTNMDIENERILAQKNYLPNWLIIERLMCSKSVNEMYDASINKSADPMYDIDDNDQKNAYYDDQLQPTEMDGTDQFDAINEIKYQKQQAKVINKNQSYQQSYPQDINNKNTKNTNEKIIENTNKNTNEK